MTTLLKEYIQYLSEADSPKLNAIKVWLDENKGPILAAPSNRPGNSFPAKLAIKGTKVRIVTKPKSNDDYLQVDTTIDADDLFEAKVVTGDTKTAGMLKITWKYPDPKYPGNNLMHGFVFRTKGSFNPAKHVKHVFSEIHRWHDIGIQIVKAKPFMFKKGNRPAIRAIVDKGEFHKTETIKITKEDGKTVLFAITVKAEPKLKVIEGDVDTDVLKFDYDGVEYTFSKL